MVAIQRHGGGGGPASRRSTTSSVVWALRVMFAFAVVITAFQMYQGSRLALSQPAALSSSSLSSTLSNASVGDKSNKDRHPQNGNNALSLSAAKRILSLSVAALQATADQRPVATVAYAVSITGCGSDPITEGAAILKHSIHRQSIRGTGSGDSTGNAGRYDYAMFAIAHPSALQAGCVQPLAELGYTILERETPVAVEDIQGDYLRTHITSNGCCGEKELIKLEAYTLTDYPIVVHLDLDVLVLQPLDDLFDLMLLTDQPDKDVTMAFRQHAIMWQDRPLPAKINAFYTVDYNMVHPHTKFKPVQGGFLVTRPSRQVYEEFRHIILQGDFREHSGWGGQVGPFYGSMTFQGITPYYYNVVKEGQDSVELNRCVYNQMCDNPRTGRTVNDILSGDCRSGQATCEDCRSRPLEDVVTMHATLCQKFWWCLPHNEDRIQDRLCRKLIQAWFQIRSDLEQMWGRSGQGTGTYQTDMFFGYCTRSGKSGYLPIEKPYGGPVIMESH